VRPILPVSVARKSVLMLTALAVACSGSRIDPALLRGDTVIVGVTDSADVLLPDFLGDAQFLTWSSLATIGADGELEPNLAESWHASSDGQVWTWHLREDARWHDGEIVTAHDVKFTLGLISHPDVLYSWSRAWPQFTQNTLKAKQESMTADQLTDSVPR